MQGSVIRVQTSASNETNKEMLKVRITSNTASNEQKSIRKEIAKLLEEKNKGFTIKAKLGSSSLPLNLETNGFTRLPKNP